MKPVGTNSAIVAWRVPRLESEQSSDLWPFITAGFASNRVVLDEAVQNLQTGPIRFEPSAGSGVGALLPHLAHAKSLAAGLATRTAVELHAGERAEAWTNLVAVTRLATAWEPAPFEVEHLVRFACVEIAWRATWSTLAARCWTESQLATLQHQWETAELWREIPETAAFMRAAMLDVCRAAREDPNGPSGAGVLPSLGSLADELQARPPQMVAAQLAEASRGVTQALRYRRHGSYQDELAIMRHYRSREDELKAALTRSTWREMRSSPGITNHPPMKGAARSPVVTLFNMRMINSRWTTGTTGILGRAAEAEVRRRMVIAAIALERYRLAHGQYPATLAGLAGLTAQPLTDFMDGQPLRYKPLNDGQFVLYSVGLDCKDDGGRRSSPGRVVPFQAPTGDLVWPRVASDDETRAEAETPGNRRLAPGIERYPRDRRRVPRAGPPAVE